MNIHEYQAKQILSDYGIPVPVGKLASTVEEAKQCAQMLERNAWVLKAQIHAGGRGQAGGVHVVDSLSKIAEVSHQLLGTRLVTKQTGDKGLPVNSVWIEETVALKREFYLSLLVERVSEKLVFIVSAAGGMDIEEVALKTPEKILSVEVNLIVGLQSYQCRRVAYALSLKGEQIRIMERIMRGMYQVFIEKDASQIEINPLVETESGNLLALDAKITFDDNALSGHSDILALRDWEQEDIKENKAQGFGLNYITLSGNIGCMVNGAGLAMATMDLVKLKGGEPANFLDVGGEATAARVTEAFKIILSDEQVKAILVNIFGGIVQCDMIAEGLIIAIQEVKMTIPIVVRLEGTNAELGRQLLNNSGLSVIAAEDLETAAMKVVDYAEGI
ncbi:MAG TPA: ADP-forming succinate--CoA ligase subunit beta [Methylococcaceae bacterium]|jgi:succinyl-CoA synthetase beta subunit|nr:ADP-forming succinate--CoA ligase subunit beta [Methylococcaceae bacterium]HIN67818.1 ADP-forming succinate--CoA ligase subunit beta [Methylococcales bacterium]HIA45523.1 ADP-forming succinate--CoA ligase subunit beta [Methylococcaceae bacterium]HIB62891.1 ADP-forming succinate--CoA ligase subunit beta [Methylococcaceae bacterium]HIO12097.1 ADP-forming succinate--CoA ligase subunit beta [Methylococcales bacterium]